MNSDPKLDARAPRAVGEKPTPAAKRMRKVSRAKLVPSEQVKVWARAGGVCVLCGRYLLEGKLTGLGVSLGELAHIVGQQENAASPRGQDPLPRAERDLAANVLLACPSCHNEIDKQLVAKILDVDALKALKARHEQRIKHVVSLGPDSRTVVLRLVGVLRGNPLELSDETVAKTVISNGHYPWFDLDRDRIGAEIDIRGLPGEMEGDAEYFASAVRLIDEVLDHKLGAGIRSGQIKHISVFPWARLPLVIYLGSKLEDNVEIDPYQRHRATQNWNWFDGDVAPTFDAQKSESAVNATELVLVLNISGSVSLDELPDSVRTLPSIRVTPPGIPSPDTVRSKAALGAFTAAVRDLNAYFDGHKSIRTVHVFGALPAAAAIEFGRLHDPHIHPSLVLYDRKNDGSYVRALEI